MMMQKSRNMELHLQFGYINYMYINKLEHVTSMKQHVDV